MIFVWFKRQCEQYPQNLESGGSADRHGTNFFGFPIQNYLTNRVVSSWDLLLPGKNFGHSQKSLWGHFWYHGQMGPLYLVKKNPKFYLVQNRSKLTKKCFFKKNSKFHPICMKFIFKIKNNVSNVIQVDFRLKKLTKLTCRLSQEPKILELKSKAFWNAQCLLFKIKST